MSPFLIALGEYLDIREQYKHRFGADELIEVERCGGNGNKVGQHLVHEMKRLSHIVDFYLGTE